MKDGLCLKFKITEIQDEKKRFATYNQMSIKEALKIINAWNEGKYSLQINRNRKK